MSVSKYINSYLLPAEEIIIKKRSEPLSDFLKMPKGNMPYGKGLIISSLKENIDYVNKEFNTNYTVINQFCVYFIVFDQSLNDLEFRLKFNIEGLGLSLV